MDPGFGQPFVLSDRNVFRSVVAVLSQRIARLLTVLERLFKRSD
jgi:hypothetical protein